MNYIKTKITLDLVIKTEILNIRKKMSDNFKRLTKANVYYFVVFLHRFLRKQKIIANGLLGGTILGKQEWGNNIREAEKEKNKSNVMHCGTATKEMDLVVRS